MIAPITAENLAKAYLPLVGGRQCYLATWRDNYSRRVVSSHAYRTGAHGPGAGTDAAPASAWPDYPGRPRQSIYQLSLPNTHRIEKALALASYSRPGNPYDNTHAEAGWSTLKTELLPNSGTFATIEEACLEVAYYTTSIPTSILTAATLLWATARPTNLNVIA